MIDKFKTYRTRDGREVRIYATDGTDDQGIHGAVKDGNGWTIAAWYGDGVHARSSRNGPRDLIEVRPRHKRTVWLNVYGRPDDVTAYNDKWKADQSVSPRIACIKVDLDFEEGEGL
jgi:hypothetical protein